jgi:hypothetical protein
MDLDETEARNDCAGEGQQQFNRQTDRLQWLRVWGCCESRPLAEAWETEESLLLETVA